MISTGSRVKKYFPVQIFSRNPKPFFGLAPVFTHFCRYKKPALCLPAESGKTGLQFFKKRRGSWVVSGLGRAQHSSPEGR